MVKKIDQMSPSEMANYIQPSLKRGIEPKKEGMTPSGRAVKNLGDFGTGLKNFGSVLATKVRRVWHGLVAQEWINNEKVLANLEKKNNEKVLTAEEEAIIRTMHDEGDLTNDQRIRATMVSTFSPVIRVMKDEGTRRDAIAALRDTISPAPMMLQEEESTAKPQAPKEPLPTAPKHKEFFEHKVSKIYFDQITRYLDTAEDISAFDDQAKKMIDVVGQELRKQKILKSFDLESNTIEIDEAEAGKAGSEVLGAFIEAAEAYGFSVETSVDPQVAKQRKTCIDALQALISKTSHFTFKDSNRKEQFDENTAATLSAKPGREYDAFAERAIAALGQELKSQNILIKFDDTNKTFELDASNFGSPLAQAFIAAAEAYGYSASWHM